MSEYQYAERGLNPQDFKATTGQEADMASGLAAGASTGNPWIMAGMVGLKAIQAHKQREEAERRERYQAQVSASNKTQNALAQLSNIGKALKL